PPPPSSCAATPEPSRRSPEGRSPCTARCSRSSWRWSCCRPPRGRTSRSRPTPCPPPAAIRTTSPSAATAPSGTRPSGAASRGPYGITTTPEGDVYYASLAGNYIARLDLDTGAATVIEPPTRDQGARRVWADSKGRIWVSEWNAGHVSRYDPRRRAWTTWKLPGARPRAYAIYVDDADVVWLSDWTANAVVRFDPEREKFEVFPSDGPRPT